MMASKPICVKALSNLEFIKRNYCINMRFTCLKSCILHWYLHLVLEFGSLIWNLIDKSCSINIRWNK